MKEYNRASNYITELLAAMVYSTLAATRRAAGRRRHRFLMPSGESR